jgi:hypothetical protein
MTQESLVTSNIRAFLGEGGQRAASSMGGFLTCLEIGMRSRDDGVDFPTSPTDCQMMARVRRRRESCRWQCAGKRVMGKMLMPPCPRNEWGDVRPAVSAFVTKAACPFTAIVPGPTRSLYLRIFGRRLPLRRVLGKTIAIMRRLRFPSAREQGTPGHK